jgi:hypothetical protein
MNVPFIPCIAPVLCFVLAATAGLSQELPAIPPTVDPTFWGRANEPYTLELTETSARANGNNASQTRVSKVNVYRDSTGRVRTESFYDNGQLMTAWIRDPGKNTITIMKVIEKSAYVMPSPRPGIPPPGRGWAVEQLPSRFIDGFPFEGLRFTQSILGSADGQERPDTMIEEDWVSRNLSVVLEQNVKSQKTGTKTQKVLDFKQAEPDPTLFIVPADYTIRQVPRLTEQRMVPSP